MSTQPLNEKNDFTAEAQHLLNSGEEFSPWYRELLTKLAAGEDVQISVKEAE